MSGHSYRREIGLIVLFAAIVLGVPLAQICIELVRGERAQCADLFRYVPSEKNLREFETTLEDKSWFQRTLRREMQSFLFKALQDTGSKGMMGRNGWVFYRPGVRYLVEPNRLELDERDSAWVRSPGDTTRRDSVVQAIVRFRDQLSERGIRLLVVPVPGKASVYPDMLTRRAADRQGEFRSPTLELIEQLGIQEVDTVDLFGLFRRARKGKPLFSSGKAYYLARDTHWTPTGMKLAAEAVAQKVRGMGLTPEFSRQYAVRRVEVIRYGDILEMMQVPGIQEEFPGEAVECEQVVHKALGLLVQPNSPRAGTYMSPAAPGQETSILVLGDSFCRIYQLAEPRSLGRNVDQTDRSRPEVTREGEKRTKRLLPGSAGFISHLALALEAPVDYIVSDGGASTDVRRKLSTNAEIIEGKKLVIWVFAERDIGLGKEGWKDVSLPPRLPGM